MAASHYRDVVEVDAGATALGVAAATRTVSPAATVSGGLLMIRSDSDKPETTSTLSPRSRPNCTCLRTTLSLLSRVATCVPDRVVLSWDIALSEQESGHYSAGVVLLNRGEL